KDHYQWSGAPTMDESETHIVRNERDFNKLISSFQSNSRMAERSERPGDSTGQVPAHVGSKRQVHAILVAMLPRIRCGTRTYLAQLSTSGVTSSGQRCLSKLAVGLVIVLRPALAPPSGSWPPRRAMRHIGTIVRAEGGLRRKY